VGASLVWTSNLINVPIGTGETFDAALPAGTHVIQLTVTDADGNRGSKSITLFIDDQKPSAKINHPGTGETRKAALPVPFAGTGNDPQDGTLTGAALVWTSDKVAQPIGTGLAFTASLPAGKNIVTLTVTDKDGNKGSDSVTLTME
jgi:hypothetical protein